MIKKVVKKIIKTLKKNEQINSFVSQITRESLAINYIRGEGIEIGALHNPLKISKSVKIKYLDKSSSEQLRKENPTFENIVDVNIIDNGEFLEKLKSNSLDFIIANHFLEHCQNPIGTIERMLEILKKEGVIFLAIPDKRYTSDKVREITTVEHILKDYEDCGKSSRKDHYLEYLSSLKNLKGDELIEVANDYEKRGISIHFHVWTQKDMFDMFSVMKEKLNFSFDIVSFLKKEGGTEAIFVLRKN